MRPCGPLGHTPHVHVLLGEQLAVALAELGRGPVWRALLLLALLALLARALLLLCGARCQLLEVALCVGTSDADVDRILTGGAAPPPPPPARRP